MYYCPGIEPEDEKHLGKSREKNFLVSQSTYFNLLTNEIISQKYQYKIKDLIRTSFPEPWREARDDGISLWVTGNCLCSACGQYYCSGKLFLSLCHQTWQSSFLSTRPISSCGTPRETNVKLHHFALSVFKGLFSPPFPTCYILTTSPDRSFHS